MILLLGLIFFTNVLSLWLCVSIVKSNLQMQALNRSWLKYCVAREKEKVIFEQGMSEGPGVVVMWAKLVDLLVEVEVDLGMGD